MIFPKDGPELSQGLQQEVFDLLHQGAAVWELRRKMPGLYMVVFFQWDKKIPSGND